jgi:riboflavin transporter FmnP
MNEDLGDTKAAFFDGKKKELSRTAKLTGIALFSSVAIVLGLTVKIPFFPANTGLYFEIWEIPIVIAFLIIGWESGIYAALVNFVALLLIFPGQLPAGPLYNLLAVISMLIGVSAGQWLASKAKGPNPALVVFLATLFGVIFRVATMTVVNSLLVPLPPPLGFNIPFQGVLALLPIYALFNAITALYTIPLAYGGVRAVALRYRLRTPIALEKSGP